MRCLFYQLVVHILFFITPINKPDLFHEAHSSIHMLGQSEQWWDQPAFCLRQQVAPFHQSAISTSSFPANTTATDQVSFAPHSHKMASDRPSTPPPPAAAQPGQLPRGPLTPEQLRKIVWTLDVSLLTSNHELIYVYRTGNKSHESQGPS